MRFFDTHLGKKIDFLSLKDKEVSMYVCGPTVYDIPHLGHGRSAVSFDVVRRYLEYRGYDVRFVSNYTDIDDKMINRARDNSISVAGLAEKVIPEYEKDYARLNILPPTVRPRATEHVDSMIDIIKKLDTNGHIYVLDDGVYFDIDSFPAYGDFSGQKLEDLQMGARVAVNENKRNPYDFALWKFKKDGEPFWESPWGDGRPGWHIECSAMSFVHLGRRFDIHGGGLDLVFPHHECEVAQSVGAFGKGAFANHWIHNGFINIDNEKMSKSLNNFFTLQDIFKVYDPLVVRFMFLQTHYRNPINFSNVLLDQAKSALHKIRKNIVSLRDAIDSFSENDISSLDFEFVINTARSDFEAFMDDDFNTSGALGVVFTFFSKLNDYLSSDFVVLSSLNSAMSFLRDVDSVFAFMFSEEEVVTEELSGAVLSLIKERDEARSRKDFAKSDTIRDELKSLGYEVVDTAEGTVCKKV